MNEALEKYRRTFGEDFPTIPLALSRPENEVIAIINECIKYKKDVYEMGILNLDDDY